jgi:prophage regulatory protein
MSPTEPEITGSYTTSWGTIEPSISAVARTAASPTVRILRLKEVCTMVGLGRSFIYRLQAESRFPHSVKIGVRAVGWLDDEVRNWLAERIAASRRDEPDVN